MRPTQTEAPEYFFRYINLVKADSVEEAVAHHSQALKEFYNAIPESKADYSYAEGKWTVKEALQHLIDAERVFTYRALRFARKDTTALHSFDENGFAKNSFANERTLTSLKEEFNTLRASTDIMLQALNEEQLNTPGTANNKPQTVNAIGFIIFGHLLHHQIILCERYLQE